MASCRGPRTSRGAISAPELVAFPVACPLSDDNRLMANQAKMTITVGANRGSSTIAFSTKGRYISLPVNGISADLLRQPIQPTASAVAFWQSVLAIVTAQLPAAAG